MTNFLSWLLDTQLNVHEFILFHNLIVINCCILRSYFWIVIVFLNVLHGGQSANLCKFCSYEKVTPINILNMIVHGFLQLLGFITYGVT